MSRKNRRRKPPGPRPGPVEGGAAAGEGQGGDAGKRRKGRPGRQPGQPTGPSPLQKRIHEAIAVEVEKLGYDLVELRVDAGRNIRILIDREGPPSAGAPPGIRIADCELVSRLALGVLSSLGHDPGGFQVEVASPGIERPLTRAKDYERFRGSQVTLSLKRSRDDGRRNFTGTLVGATDSAVTLHVLDQDAPESFPRDAIRLVRLRPPVETPTAPTPRERKAKGRRRRKGS